MEISQKTEVNTQYSTKTGDRIKFSYLKNTLLVGMINPSKKEVIAYSSGSVNIKLVLIEDVIFITFKIADLDWSDVAFSIFLDFIDKAGNFEKKLQDSNPIKLYLVLYDADTRDVLVKRALNPPEDFSNSLKNAVIKQYNTQLSFNEYRKNVDEVYNKYSSAHLSMNKLVNARCVISGEKYTQIREVVYDRYGYGTDKRIPKWMYNEFQNPKVYGLMTKESIPDDLLRKGVVKIKYKKVQNKYWYAVLYKNHVVKKKRKNKLDKSK